MSETLTHAPESAPQDPSLLPESMPSVPQITPEQIAENTAHRESVVKDLLGMDYDYAKESGLVDMFYYDPVTGEDGFMHTFGGNLRNTPNGMVEPLGYHHEPSGEAIWPKTIHPETGETQPTTRVHREHLASLNNRERARFKEHPLEPYRAQVVIGGLTKYAPFRENGETTYAPARSSMFPKEYDALPVMQSIRAAMSDPERTVEPSVNDEGVPVTVVQGNAKLLDGKTDMPVRMVLDAQNGKIRTAIPIIKNRPGYMKLTPEQAAQVPFDPNSYGSKR